MRTIFVPLLWCSICACDAHHAPTTHNDVMQDAKTVRDAGPPDAEHPDARAVEEDADNGSQCTDVSDCVEIRHLITPDPGEEGLVSYHYKNTCEHAITVHQCIEQRDGTCNCSWHHQMPPGVSSTFYATQSMGTFSWTAIHADNPNACIDDCPCPGGCH